MMVAASNGSAPGRSERAYLIKFNTEYSERYWLQPYVETGQSCVVMLLDLRDHVALDMAARLGSPEKVAALIAHSAANDMIPTMHAAVPMELALALMGAMVPAGVEMTRHCPDDAFVLWCIGSGGSSLGYRKRPAVESPCESGGAFPS